MIKVVMIAMATKDLGGFVPRAVLACPSIYIDRSSLFTRLIPSLLRLFHRNHQRHRAQHTRARAAASLSAILSASNPGHTSLFAVELVHWEVSR